MKQVMRESLKLLNGGQYLSLLDDRELKTEHVLTYQDFQLLRPQFQASSWRGAMSKALERGWVQKRSISGKTGFQLTKLGRQVVLADFTAHRQFLRTSAFSFLLVQSDKKQFSQQVRELLQRSSGQLLLPGIWVFPLEVIPDLLLDQARALGAKTLVIPSRSSAEGSRLGLSEWLLKEQKDSASTFILSLEEVSKSMSRLLEKSNSKKRMHHMQISQLGHYSIQVLSWISKLPWVVLEDSFLSESVFQALEQLDLVFSKWKQESED